jgi:transposase
MIRNGEFYLIHDMRKRGMNVTQIAEEMGRDRKTIRKWLNEQEPRRYQRTVKKPCKLDAYKDYIRERMEEGCLNATVLFEEIQERGYTGGSTMVREFMKPLRPLVIQKATVRFETPPGYQAQVDWGKFAVEWAGATKRLYAFVKVLGHSRMLYLEFTEDEKLDTLMGCHLRAMQYFGGRTEVILYDNMKTVVTGVDSEGHPIWNERFSRFAAHHGFLLKRCRPYRARTKGKVENGISYVRKNFWPRIRTFTGLDDLNMQARRWMDQVANSRVHGTTQCVPLERWLHEGLKAINPTPFAEVERHPRKVSSDSMVSYDSCRYSVPHRYVGQTVDVQDQRNGRITIYSADQLVADHPKSFTKREMVIDRSHFEGLTASGQHKVPTPMPKLAPRSAPEVIERDLSVYEQFLDEAVTLQ